MELRNTLQLNISYQLYLMRVLPRGYIGTHNNKPAVFITRDPDDPSVTSRNKKRYYLNRNKGKYYAQQVNRYLKAKSDYERLMREWKSIYKGNPTIVQYPLDKRLLTGLSSDFFKKAKPNQNPKKHANSYEYNGQILRSKNELLGVQELEKMGFEWKTEIEIGKDQYPDATFDVPYLGKALILEIDGKMECDIRL